MGSGGVSTNYNPPPHTQTHTRTHATHTNKTKSTQSIRKLRHWISTRIPGSWALYPPYSLSPSFSLSSNSRAIYREVRGKEKPWVGKRPAVYLPSAIAGFSLAPGLSWGRGRRGAFQIKNLMLLFNFKAFHINYIRTGSFNYSTKTMFWSLKW